MEEEESIMPSFKKCVLDPHWPHPVPQEQKQNPVPALRCIHVCCKAKLTWMKPPEAKGTMCTIQKQAGWGAKREEGKFGFEARVGAMLGVSMQASQS